MFVPVKVLLRKPYRKGAIFQIMVIDVLVVEYAYITTRGHEGGVQSERGGYHALFSLYDHQPDALV